MKTALSALTLVTLAALAACESAPLEPVADGPSFTVIGADNPNGTIVLNKGVASEPFVGACFFSGRTTNEVTVQRRKNGGALLSCHWADFPDVDATKAIVIKDFRCVLNYLGQSETTKSQFTYNQGGGANMHCTFDEII